MSAAKFVSKITDLPAPSLAVVKLMALLNRHDADNKQVVKVVKCDGVLCGKLLAACNSAAAALSQRIGPSSRPSFISAIKKCIASSSRSALAEA